MQDHDIVDMYFARNENAIKLTSEKYESRLLALSERITQNRADAEECVNDTYLAAWYAIPPERPTHLFAYLSRIARNRACNIVQSRSRQKRATEQVELTDELTECLPSESNVDAELESERLSRVIDGFLRKLDQKTRYVFMRRYYFSDTYEQLSSATGQSETALRSMLHRARKKLRQLLIKEGFTV